MKKNNYISFLLLALFIGVSLLGAHEVSAQSSALGASCGNTINDPKCSVADIGKVTKGVLSFIITLGLPLTVIFVAYRFIMAWFALQQGNANAYKDALKKAGNAILGFMFIVALFGGLFFAALKMFGVKDNYLQVFKGLISVSVVEHAYAADTQTASVNNSGVQALNPVGATSLYDFILSALRLVVRFFIYPALIAIWVWAGFAFVFAQGAPDALNKAKKLLMWAFITTVIIFMLQAFLTALRGTVQKILSENSIVEQIKV